MGGVRFLADGMLGKLTHWLRMLGQDVKYTRSLSDEELMRLARRERRVLLTSDVELFRRASSSGVDVYLVRRVDRAEALAELSKRFGVPLVMDVSVSRCPKCNSPIERVPKEEVRDLVPPRSWATHTEFWRCTGCGQVYWMGSHWRRINETLEKARKLREAMEKTKNGGG